MDINYCVVKDCKQIATYSKLKNCILAATYCFKHTTDDYFNIKINYCIEKDCKKPALYGKSVRSIRCLNHKKEDDVRGDGINYCIEKELINEFKK